jgi:hypothetical protein
MREVDEIFIPLKKSHSGNVQQNMDDAVVLAVSSPRSDPVLGMTYGAYHGPSNMPAGIPGVSTASAREDRLSPKGRLRQQPTGDSTEENWSRAMKTKLPNSCLAKK